MTNNTAGTQSENFAALTTENLNTHNQIPQNQNRYTFFAASHASSNATTVDEVKSQESGITMNSRW